jgi:AcrR family transcriptional regulator
LRADAARNVQRILRATREVYAALGPDVHIEAVARRAGVGERTLYRRFPSKGDLIRAALDQSIDENLSPAIEAALDGDDPLTGLAELIDAATTFGAREHNILAAARRVGALTNISDRLEEAMTELMHRAQRAGLVRADLVAEDLPRIVMMLNSVLWTMDPASGGWHRYVALVLDAVSTAQRRELPAAVAIRYASTAESWPM